MILFVSVFGTLLGLFVIALLQRNTPQEPVAASDEAGPAPDWDLLALIGELDDEECERLVRRLMTGYGLEVVKFERATADSYEVIAHWPQALIGGNYLVCFARPESGDPIESKTMREFKEAAYEERALKGIFITTTQFSQEARFVGDHYGVELVDGGRLLDLLQERTPTFLAQLRQRTLES